MKNYLLVFLFVFVNFSVFAQLQTVAVATFDGTGGVSSDEAQVVTELFITELVSTGAVNVVDRNNFARIMTEMKFQSSDWASNDRTIELGRALNAGFIIRGQLMKMGSKIYWTATMIDANTAQVISSAREQFEDFDNIFRRLPAFCQQIVSKLPPPNYFIGKWQSTKEGKVLILEFKSDMSINVERYDFLEEYSSPRDGLDRTSYTGTGTGIYSYDSNQITISVNLIFPRIRNNSHWYKSDNESWSITFPYSFFDNKNRFNFPEDNGFRVNATNSAYVIRHVYNSFVRIK